jgi:hypothetical protein
MALYKQILCIAGLATALFAQTDTLKGKVKDAKTGAFVADAKVWLAEQPKCSTTTDAMGNFILRGIDGTVGVRTMANGHVAIEPTLNKSMLYFSAEQANELAKVDIFSVSGRHVASVLNQRIAQGTYGVNPYVAGLSSEIYLLRAQIGAKTTTLKMPVLSRENSASRNALRQLTSDEVSGFMAKTYLRRDTILTSKAGYKVGKKVITAYNQINVAVDLPPIIPAVNTWIFPTDGTPTVDWGENAAYLDLMNWGGAAISSAPTGLAKVGTYATMVTGMEGVTAANFGFGYKSTSSVTSGDMSSWTGGILHMWLLGNAPTVGISITWANGMGMNADVNVADTAYGYKPDEQWHEINIPLSAFGPADMEHITNYFTMSMPATKDTSDKYFPGTYCIFDDVCWRAPVTTTK